MVSQSKIISKRVTVKEKNSRRKKKRLDLKELPGAYSTISECSRQKEDNKAYKERGHPNPGYNNCKMQVVLPPSSGVSEVHNVRLSLKSCMIKVLSL